jgi:hypothetical protein
MGITWALFRYVNGEWQFCGTTRHDEFATEFEQEYDDEVNDPVQVVALEDPTDQSDDDGIEDVPVKDNLL